MAKFCSECGQSTTELMRRCPRCEAPLMSSNRENSMVRIAIIIIGSFILLSTLLSWYTLSISLDGGVLDTVAGFASRIIPGYSGISTRYGIVIFALSLTMIITAVCKERVLTLIAACACAAVGTMALLSPPDLAMLCSNGGDDVASSKQLLSILDGPLSSIKSGTIQSYTTILEIVMKSIVVEIGSGLKIMLILVYSATILSIIDLVKAIMLKRATKQ